MNNIANKVFYLVLISISFSSCLKKEYEFSNEDRKLIKEMKKIDDGSLLGPDKNNNGIRDDIDYWIKHSSLIKNNDLKNAAQYYAKQLREKLRLLGKDRETRLDNFYEASNSNNCLVKVTVNNNFKNIWAISDPIYHMTFNTEERLKAGRRADGVGAGEVIISKNFASEACPFKLELDIYPKRTE